jgi:hypothetical protein
MNTIEKQISEGDTLRSATYVVFVTLFTSAAFSSSSTAIRRFKAEQVTMVGGGLRDIWVETWGDSSLSAESISQLCVDDPAR